MSNKIAFTGTFEVGMHGQTLGYGSCTGNDQVCTGKLWVCGYARAKIGLWIMDGQCTGMHGQTLGLRWVCTGNAQVTGLYFTASTPRNGEMSMLHVLAEDIHRCTE